ncbi:MAG: hypothetical protein IJY48_06815 [Mailhella sp.]|nr:hypothetical protein [Mailhella sp.]MBQ9105819.1 hypothetical protein [Mailhella sp.]
MSDTRYLSELFDIQPPNWGLRGDPWFWQDLKQAFAHTAFPYSSPELVADIHRIFKEKTGEELSTTARPYVAAYDHGGNSAGRVSGKWWLTTAMPILIALRDIAEANMKEFDNILKDGTARFALRSPACTPA